MEKDFNSGFLFGIDNCGRLIGAVSAGGEWKKCISEQKLELLTWTHVAMTFSSDNGIRLFINGKVTGELNFTGTLDLCRDCKMAAGKTQTFAPAANTERATSKAVKTQNRFDGLMDEPKVYDVALKPEQILANYKEVQFTNPQPLSYRKMPSGEEGGKRNFGAYYTKLKYAPGWDVL